MALLEGSEDCAATASGMAAVHAALMCQLRVGHAGRRLGPAVRLLPLDPDPALPALRDRGRAGRRQGSRRLGAGARPPGRPRVPGIAGQSRRSSWSTSPRSAALAHRAGAKVIVDNVFATPLLQRPLELGADLVVYSGTKHIDGQGRCLGGLICCDTRLPQDRAPSLPAQYRPGHEPVQCLGPAQGAGDPAAAGAGDERGARRGWRAGWRRTSGSSACSIPAWRASRRHELARRQMSGRQLADRLSRRRRRGPRRSPSSTGCG